MADAGVTRRAPGRALVDWLVAGPRYEPSPADTRTVSVAGLELPVRATIALAVVTLALLFDFSRTFIPRDIQDLQRAAEALRFQALERTVLFGLIPVAIVVLVFRDRPARYGLRLGDWRAGLPLAVVGMAAMTPLLLVLAAIPQFRAYYAVSSTNPLDLTITHLLDLVPTEFLLRGFLMFTLLRAIGPIGVVVAVLPFAFSHLGKPEVELFSTLIGGTVFGWVNWRTGSIVWSALAHVYIQTLLLAAVGGPPGIT